MKILLGAEFEAYRASLDEPARRGLRVNRLKCAPEELLPLLGIAYNPVPFSPDGVEISAAGLGNHPLHHAGAFYLQEPSAMSAATALDARLGDRVLDLCAAPGGKATALGAALRGEGLLWANEISAARAQTLLSNIERMGIVNAVVSNEPPGRLCARLPGFFDKVLVDAPCSGEGMLRKEPEAARQWSLANLAACAARQREILESAAPCVREGGLLCYSTCTFAPEENEGVVADFLAAHPDFELAEISAAFGRPALRDALPALCGRALPARLPIERARRILPADGGEGHFVALMRRIGPAPSAPPLLPRTPARVPAFEAFCAESFSRPLAETALSGTPALLGDSLLLLPPLPDVRGLRLLRAGVLAGKVRAGRNGAAFAPAHALYHAADPKILLRTLSLALGDEGATRFLQGHVLEAPGASGYCAVLAGGFVLGFGKGSDGMLKNHYPKGLRLRED